MWNDYLSEVPEVGALSPPSLLLDNHGKSLQASPSASVRSKATHQLLDIFLLSLETWYSCRVVCLKRHAWTVWDFQVKQTLWRSLSRVCEACSLWFLNCESCGIGIVLIKPNIHLRRVIIVVRRVGKIHQFLIFVTYWLQPVVAVLFWSWPLNILCGQHFGHNGGNHSISLHSTIQSKIISSLSDKNQTPEKFDLEFRSFEPLLPGARPS